MPRKKEDINDYCTAGDAAQLLSEKLHRPIRTDYISKIANRKTQTIRVARFGKRRLYHRGDILACTIREKIHTTSSIERS